MTQIDIEIGKRLRMVRKVARISQVDMANAYGNCHTTVRRHERGENAIPVAFVLAVYNLAQDVMPGALPLEWILLGEGQPLQVERTMEPVPNALPAAKVDDLLTEQQLQAAESVHKTACESRRPFVLLKPQLFADGNAWCALYGKDLQEGVAGFGDTPEAAAVAFDLAWRTQRTSGALLKRRA